MKTMPLYRVENNSILQIKQTVYPKEKELQCLFEANLKQLLDVRFVATEVTTGDRQRGRIDTLGLDQDSNPTIIEYKKSSKENIINQGLFYLDWLVDHRGDFTLVAQSKLGADIKIDWSHPRLILVAETFSEYDKYAVNRIGANIELWTFRKYGDDLLYLDPLFIPSLQTTKGASIISTTSTRTKETSKSEDISPFYTLEYHTRKKPKDTVILFEQLRREILGLAEAGEITEKPNKMYISYSHGKNFCEVRLQSKVLQIWLDIPLSDLDDPDHLGRDVSKIGRYGTGVSEIKITNSYELRKVIQLIEQSFRLTM
jgi:predicted transport protein